MYIKIHTIKFQLNVDQSSSTDWRYAVRIFWLWCTYKTGMKKKNTKHKKTIVWSSTLYQFVLISFLTSTKPCWRSRNNNVIFHFHAKTVWSKVLNSALKCNCQETINEYNNNPMSIWETHQSLEWKNFAFDLEL